MTMTQPIPNSPTACASIFGLVVEAYLERGHPVGSKALAGSVSLSPASIRGVMQELEERGLLTHPHTSAGRVPTESGLRLFVDGIMQALARPARAAAIEAQIDRDQPIEQALAAASAALSGLSSCAGVVLAPKQELRLRQLNFVPSTRAARWRCWSAPTAASRTGSCSSTAARPGGARRGRQFRQCALVRDDAGEAEARLREEITERKEAIDSAAAELVASGLAAWSEDHAAARC